MIRLLFIIFYSVLFANYDVENAFPNLSFEDPVGIYTPNDGSNRLFVIEQEGRIKVFDNNPNVSSWDMFLDIDNIVDQDGGYTEEGLLGLAFHPNFEENGYFYVNYTEHNPRRNVIARYTVSNNNPNEANYSSSEIILEVGQPYTNHNGGQMGFGPDDGYLYISFGDGGSAGDPLGHGQNLSTLLGSLIRIDVDNPSGNLNYSIPSDNPFINDPNAEDEIYAYKDVSYIASGDANYDKLVYQLENNEIDCTQEDLSIQEKLDSGCDPFDLVDAGLTVDELYGSTFGGGLIFWMDTELRKGMVAASDRVHGGMGESTTGTRVKVSQAPQTSLELWEGENNTELWVNAGYASPALTEDK